MARVLASTLATNRTVRKQCLRLLEKGLECSAATSHHDWLNAIAAVGLLCFIRGFQLHVDLPNHQSQNSDYSPGFITLYNTWRRVTQRLLAAPIAVIVLHFRVPKDELWKHAKLILKQVAISIGLFLAGNLLCLIAAFPVSTSVPRYARFKAANDMQDVDDTIHALEVSGLTGKTEV
jgi:hypothetical protein